MGWKNWAYWLRSGFSGVIIELLTIILLFVTRVIRYEERVVYCITAPCPHFKGFITPFENLSSIHPQQFIYLLLLLMLIFFVVGAVIGLIYGKIKSKKSVSE